MLDKSLITWGLNCVSTLTSVMTFGHCTYISLVECAARRKYEKASDMVDHYQVTFPLAKWYSQRLGAIPTIASIASYYLDSAHPGARFMLAGGLTLMLLGPFTVFFIVPTNNLLLDGENPKKKGDDWIKEKMNAWCNLHSVRTLICSVSAMLYIYGLSL